MTRGPRGHRGLGKSGAPRALGTNAGPRIAPDPGAARQRAAGRPLQEGEAFRPPEGIPVKESSPRGGPPTPGGQQASPCRAEPIPLPVLTSPLTAWGQWFKPGDATAVIHPQPPAARRHAGGFRQAQVRVPLHRGWGE